MELLFVFVLGVFLLAVRQTCLPGKGVDLQEKKWVTLNPHGDQDRGGCVEQVSCQHTPERFVWDSERSCGTRVEGASDVCPLTLEGDRS